MATDLQPKTALVRTARGWSRSVWLLLVVLCGALFLDGLDVSMVGVALPSIQADLGFSQSDLAWIFNAYLISFGGLLLLAGRIGDLVGQRRVFLVGLTVFTAASLACALAGSHLRRHPEREGWYARQASTDGQRIVYARGGELWLLDDLQANEPVRLDITLGSPVRGRAARQVVERDRGGGRRGAGMGGCPGAWWAGGRHRAVCRVSFKP